MAITVEDLTDELYNSSDVSGETEAVPTQEYNGNFKRPSYYVGGDEALGLKSRDQYIADWNEANPEPTKPQTVVAKQEEMPTYADLLAAYESQPQEKSEKAKRANMIISGIGDAVNAISGLVGAYHSGVYHAPKTTLSETMQARYDKIEKEQREDRQKYREMLMKRAQLRQRDYQAKQKANDALADAQNKANETAYQNAVKARNTQLNTDLTGLTNAQRAKDTKDYRDKQQENFERSYQQRYDIATAPTTTTSVSHPQAKDLDGSPSVDENGKPVTFTNTNTSTSRKNVRRRV